MKKVFSLVCALTLFSLQAQNVFAKSKAKVVEVRSVEEFTQEITEYASLYDKENVTISDLLQFEKTHPLCIPCKTEIAFRNFNPRKPKDSSNKTALNYIKKAEELLPTVPECKDTTDVKGYFYTVKSYLTFFLKNNLQEAINLAKLAYDQDPNIANDLFYLYGTVSFDKGLKEQAYDLYNVAFTTDVDYSLAETMDMLYYFILKTQENNIQKEDLMLADKFLKCEDAMYCKDVAKSLATIYELNGYYEKALYLYFADYMYEYSYKRTTPEEFKKILNQKQEEFLTKNKVNTSNTVLAISNYLDNGKITEDDYNKMSNEIRGSAVGAFLQNESFPGTIKQDQINRIFWFFLRVPMCYSKRYGITSEELKRIDKLNEESENRYVQAQIAKEKQYKRY